MSQYLTRQVKLVFVSPVAGVTYADDSTDTSTATITLSVAICPRLSCTVRV